MEKIENVVTMTLVSYSYVLHIFQRQRWVLAVDFKSQRIRLGGENKIVEIDESLFVRVKHHKGKDLKREQVWVFGMYERLTDEEKLDPNKQAKVLFFVVEKRDAMNLLNLIYEYVLPGTIIHSNCWRALQ
jgi:hypothetical protein